MTGDQWHEIERHVPPEVQGRMERRAAQAAAAYRRHTLCSRRRAAEYMHGVYVGLVLQWIQSRRA